MAAEPRRLNLEERSKRSYTREICGVHCARQAAS